ncbi:MAG: RNA polymerase sigma factor [Candidatus Polarisedimenticolia bacterium]
MKPRVMLLGMSRSAKDGADSGPEAPDAAGDPARRPQPVDPEEADTVERARRGDREAFDRIVRRHLPHVWSVVWRIVRHRQDAEDVVQEVFLAAFQNLVGYRGEARLSTWLHRIAVTRALNHLDRREERMRRSMSSLEDEAGGGEVGLQNGTGGLLREPPSPLQALEARDLKRRLADCLERLPGAWRAILTLRDVDARSYEAIAGIAGLAIGTVRSRLARARQALRRCIAEGLP